MEQSTGSLNTSADLERALARANEMLADIGHAGPAAAQRFDDLLRQIATYHEALPRVHQTPFVDQLTALDDHLKAYGRRWPDPEMTANLDPWSPLLGGDVNPGRPARKPGAQRA